MRERGGEDTSDVERTGGERRGAAVAVPALRTWV